MEYGVVPKVWRVDYDFLISNYLDKSLWKKSWNLFAYKEHIFTLSLAMIDVCDDSICFHVKYRDRTESVWFYTRNETTKFLIRKINGAIFRLIENIEEQEIRKSTGYEEILERQASARDKYEEEANDYLDELEIEDNEIRHPYIERYVEKKDNYMIPKQQYIDYYKYNIYHDLYIEFCKATKDEVRLNKVMINYHNGEKYDLESEI